MARKSKNELASGTVRPIEVQRAKPPTHLSVEAAQVWQDVIDTKPADWFRKDTFPILEEYCESVVMVRRLNQKVGEVLSGVVLLELDLLLKIKDREGRRMLALARSLRLTQQAQLKAETAASKASKVESKGLPEPWAFEG